MRKHRNTLFPSRLLRFCLLFLSVPLWTYGQKVKTVCGEYTYYAPENESLNQARQTALQQARLAALAAEFGMHISQRNVMQERETNGRSYDFFQSLSAMEVKGEWLEDVRQPEYEIRYEQNTLVVKASVCGKAREIVAGQINFVAHVLCNGTEERFQSDRFKDGDELYLSFHSPADGYLAVYLVDGAGSAYCLLPYQGVADGKVPVKANRDYLFFSKRAATEPFDASVVDEYTLTCADEVENNYLYIIFSPKPFVKASDRTVKTEPGSLLLPRELPFADFQKWLTRNRMKDKEMQVEIRSITINQKHNH